LHAHACGKRVMTRRDRAHCIICVYIQPSEIPITQYNAFFARLAERALCQNVGWWATFSFDNSQKMASRFFDKQTRHFVTFHFRYERRCFESAKACDKSGYYSDRFYGIDQLNMTKEWKNAFIGDIQAFMLHYSMIFLGF
jgi:hypothetical protein